MTVRGIFFDAGDVLYYRARPTEEYVTDLLRQGGHRAELSEGEGEQKRAWRRQAFIGRIGPDEYWERVLLLHGVGDPGERRALAALADAQADEVMAVPGARQALVGLKQRGFLLGVITDTMHPRERKVRWLERVGVAELVDVLVCSAELGVRKPDPAIYLEAVQRAGLTTVEAAFVGHAAHELEGARRVGLLTVAVNHAPGTPADYCSASLLDLLNVPIFQQPPGPKRES